jgi:hypothetical protein
MKSSVDLSNNMLLNDFKEVLEIDSAIIDLHKDLEDLYKQRTRIFDGTTMSKTFTKTDTPLPSERQQYDDLAQTWRAVNITIPAFSKLQTKLSAAKVIQSCNFK